MDAEELGLSEVRLGFIGAGVMAESMIAGLLAKEIVQASQIVASHPRADRRERIESRFGVTAVATNVEGIEDVDLVLESLARHRSLLA